MFRHDHDLDVSINNDFPIYFFLFLLLSEKIDDDTYFCFPNVVSFRYFRSRLFRVFCLLSPKFNKFRQIVALSDCAFSPFFFLALFLSSFLVSACLLFLVLHPVFPYPAESVQRGGNPMRTEKWFKVRGHRELLSHAHNNDKFCGGLSQSDGELGSRISEHASAFTRSTISCGLA